MSRAGKIEEQARIAKEKKQKKMLIGLAPLLLLLLAWQGPGIFKAMTGGGQTAVTTPTGATTLTSTAPNPDPTGAAPTTAGTPGVVTPSGIPATLPESDGSVSAGVGQLVRFDRFHGKDPFRQQVDENEPAAPPVDEGPGDGSITPVPPSDPDPEPDDPSAFTSATLNVNGVEETLSKGATFPQSDPLFRLASIAGGNVKIGLVDGNFSNGKKTVTVRLGRTITLVSQPDGVRYVIKLVAVGTTS